MSTEEEVAKLLARLSKWGADGGRARAKKMTKKERSAHARKMALARWRKYQNNGQTKIARRRTYEQNTTQ